MAATAQQFCVRWNSYQSNLQNAFPKLLLSENFVDVTLACEAQMIKCHKVVLSACSSYFESLLSQNPCQHPIIFMKDMKFWEIRALVDFMYRGEVNVTQEELSNLLKAAEALQVRGLYGYEQQRAAAAAAAVTNNSETGATETPSSISAALPANTTLQSLQECKAQARSRGSSLHDDSNDQMVKLEEEIMMMEEQSISDSSHLDNDFSTLGSSQEFDGFVGDQRYPPPSGALDPEQGAGPSGLTMTPSASSTPVLVQEKLLGSPQQQQLQQQQQIGAASTCKQFLRIGWKRPQTKRPKNQTPLRAVHPMVKSKGQNRGPNIWESLPKEEMMKQLTLAVDMIEKGNSYRRVSNILHIPKSTIYSYVLKRREGRDMFQRKVAIKTNDTLPLQVETNKVVEKTTHTSSEESQ